MKKLLIMATAALIGVAVQAATCSWAIWDGLYEKGTTSKANGYAVYFFDDAAFSRADALTKLTASDLTFLTSGFEAEYAADNGSAELNDAGNFGNSYTIDSYMVILNAETVADATYAYLSATTEMASDTTGGAGQSAMVEFDAQLGMQTASNWISLGGEPVPEPTSGLLLLVGGALLALKRRRV